MNTGKHTKFVLVVIGALGLLAGCTGGTSDLDEYIKTTMDKPANRRIKPLRQPKPYETFVYEANDSRSPFMPDIPALVRNGAGSGIAKDLTRSREFSDGAPG